MQIHEFTKRMSLPALEEDMISFPLRGNNFMSCAVAASISHL